MVLVRIGTYQVSIRALHFPDDTQSHNLELDYTFLEDAESEIIVAKNFEFRVNAKYCMKVVFDHLDCFK